MSIFWCKSGAISIHSSPILLVNTLPIIFIWFSDLGTKAMGEKKVTTMVIKVNLECDKCRRKIKKTLCCIPQIQDQIYDEKANTVTVTVVCCSPEKIKKKISSKGAEAVKGIEIKEKPKPTAEKPKEQPEKPKDKPKESEKPKDKLKEPEKSKPPQEKAKEPKPDKPAAVAAEPSKPKAAEPAPKPPVQVPVNPLPPRAYCIEGSQAHFGGPYWEGYGRPVQCYEVYGTPGPYYEAMGRPVYDSWGGGYGYGYGGCRRGCYVGRCDCMREENPAACCVM